MSAPEAIQEDLVCRVALDAARRESAGKPAGTWAVAVDADETMIDNSGYEAGLQRQGTIHTDAAWRAWVKGHERGAIPWAKEFLSGVRQLGGRIAVVSNTEQALCADLATDLERLGLPYDVLLSPARVKGGMAMAFGPAALSGIHVVWLGGWPIIVIGVAAILAAIAYTGGPFPLGHHGFGEVFVFAFFGIASIARTFYAQAGTVSTAVWWRTPPPALRATRVVWTQTGRPLNVALADTGLAALLFALPFRLGMLVPRTPTP